MGEALVGFTYRQRETPRGARLPAPMQPAYGADAASSCLLDEEVHAAAVGWEGFAWGPSVPDAETRALQKWGWLGRSVGERLPCAHMQAHAPAAVRRARCCRRRCCRVAAAQRASHAYSL